MVKVLSAPLDAIYAMQEPRAMTAAMDDTLTIALPWFAFAQQRREGARHLVKPITLTE